MNSYSRVLFKREKAELIANEATSVLTLRENFLKTKKKKSLRDTAHLIHIFLSHSRPNFKYCTFSRLFPKFNHTLQRIHDFLPKIYVTSCISMQINMNCVRHLLKFPRNPSYHDYEETN